MAPEQAEDSTTIDIRVDIYGLGGVLFWCLTGQEPFQGGENTLVGLLRRKTQRPPSVRRHHPGLAPEIDLLVSRMMAADPNHRPPTAEAVSQELNALRDVRNRMLDR